MKLQLFTVVCMALCSSVSGIPTTFDNDARLDKDAEEAFQDALKEEQPTLDASPRAHLATKTSAQRKQVAFSALQELASGGSGKFLQHHTIGKSHAAIAEFEQDVTNFVIGLSKSGMKDPQPFGGAIDKIKELIAKQMLPAVEDAHKSNQDELNKLDADLQGCFTTRDTALAEAKKDKDIYTKASPLHKTCRDGEAGLYQENVDEHEEWKNLKQLKQSKCKAYSDSNNAVGDQQRNKEIVTKAGGESTETYARRISATICGKPTVDINKENNLGNGGHGDDGLLDKLLDAKDACEQATKAFNDQTVKCRNLDHAWHEKQKQCNSLQDTMDNGACNYALERKDACQAYKTCYAANKQAYTEAETKVRQEMDIRKEEWEGLKRMLCLIETLRDLKVTDEEIQTCKNATHSTSHLDIAFATVPEEDECLVPDLYPHTPEYKQAEFQPLPLLAKGKVDSNTCTGMNEVSEEPKTGSPQTCKCERVVLSGPYTPGPVVKCEHCLDIRRANDKNSCPAGTKIFAPQNRDDWTTILSDAGPLRAPNWIIDVTHAANGCGGCMDYNMNSETTQQDMWVTQDGSPWWLRSSVYAGTADQTLSGDYHANCFLGLEQDPPDADHITFNDHNCNYHSKSYYCQAFKVGLTPKAGSPVGCTCKKVSLDGMYSAGDLIKCEGCLDVYRSDDVNSCPLGTKLWSPRTANDWKTFIASETRLAAPHWIIDVTRPQNGCGGCSESAMNSDTPSQATWRTADGSQWWLRSEKYEEPNLDSDYTANCYMDLWAPQSSENGILFRAKKCEYHSTSYFCQTAVSAGKQDHEIKTAAPVEHTEVRISTKPKAGSPDKCHCTLVDLHDGTERTKDTAQENKYSAGGLVKCVGCLDIYKTTDKNSCPEGTKIFAPQSREDWEIFFKSGERALRAPNWIVDVTNSEFNTTTNQSSCGGCTDAPMNSADADQSVWKTTDGSPWWLRSSTFDEPNGDYTPNCYLDISVPEASPSPWDDIRLADGNCSYHSTDYYCQPETGFTPLQ